MIVAHVIVGSNPTPPPKWTCSSTVERNPEEVGVEGSIPSKSTKYTLWGDIKMEMRCSHRTSACPKCKKDTYIPEIKEYFSVVVCPWCGSKFKEGRIVKEESK